MSRHTKLRGAVSDAGDGWPSGSGKAYLLSPAEVDSMPRGPRKAPAKPTEAPSGGSRAGVGHSPDDMPLTGG